ncbi:MAG: NADH-ubiquinone oxidoreductase-F iron-sulfur binding region domain-containing protein, partial [Dehalococcoidia bacterium]|nr:NADH-ubiquinone oxidoreductase-F iron-sulfur binding region domain-containing protein [Dehalococcoidia bacterium]
LEALRREVQERKLDVDVGMIGETGLCWAEPLVEVRKPDGSVVLYERITPDRVPKLLDEALAGDGVCRDYAFAIAAGPDVDGVQQLSDIDFWQIQERRLIARCGVIDPENIDHYIATGGYGGLAQALEQGQEDVIKTLQASTLRGRSGSNFPTGQKWDFLRGKERAPKYLICNADEGDPGAFVNRILMESDPQSVIEGMLIAAYATGADFGFVYIRDEYPLCVERMQRAVDQARERGLVGDDVLGSGLAFDLEVWRGAGSYVCGEESGLLASLDDERGMPRIRPPYPADAGVFAQPTNVNNVETYADAALVMQRGLDFYSNVGTESNKGTKIFSISGHIPRVGVLELPLGFPLRDLYFAAEPAAWQERRPLKAVQAGGPLTGILPGYIALKLGLEPEQFREHGALMGGGGIVFIDDTACIVDLNVMFSWFLEDESCGRCTTCHGGTQRMMEIFRRIGRGGGREDDYNKMAILGDMLEWSNCVHGSAAPTIMLRSADFFREEIDEHIANRRCPAKVCRDLIRYEIHGKSERLPEAAEICPTDAIVEEGGAWRINERCIKCDACREIAPEAVRIVDAPRPGPTMPGRAHLQDVGRDARGRMN